MRYSLTVCFGFALCASLMASGVVRGQRVTGDQSGRMCDMDGTSDDGLLIGGVGGVYLLAAPGKLIVDIYRVDLNPDNGLTPLRAILFAPDRRVLAEKWIPAAGSARDGVRLEADVAHKGVFGVNVTLSGDRYGQRAHWGFRTNCPHYLVETSRGHRDARHQEPIVLGNPGIAGDICFMPRPGPIALEASGLSVDAGPLRLYDSSGALLQVLDVSAEGSLSGTIAAAASREHVPWRLHVPAFQGVYHIDGLTRWSRGDPHANLSLWSPDLASWFNFFDYRWLLTPYHVTAYGEASSSRDLTFEVHNEGVRDMSVALRLEGDEAVATRAALSASTLRLGPRQTGRVRVTLEFPAADTAYDVRLRATPAADPAFSTYSSISVRSGPAPARQPIPMPIVLKPYRHENRQFGYLPDYPTGNQVYFDGANRPYVLADNQLYAQGERGWKATPLSRGLGDQAGTVRQRSTKIAFDQDDNLYTVGTAAGQAVLLYSADRGETFRAAPIAGGGTFDIEQFSGHNVPAFPPPLIRFKRTAKDPKLKWRSLNDLDLFLPERHGEEVVIGDPVTLSRTCIGLSAHSGIPSSVVSRGDRVHVAWGEATDPEEKAPGVPTYVATFERGRGLLGKPALVGYGPPANDVHNSPCITIDSQGVLHVLVGTHGRTFKYARSQHANTAHRGWTEPRDVGPGLRQTYVGLVCDLQDNLHLVFRIWRSGGEYFPAGSYAQLAHMVKPAGQPWSSPRPLVIAPFSEYSIYYHRLTVDRGGRLFLSYDYWSTFWFYRMDHRGDRRALILSSDSGETWSFAANEDLRP